MLETELCELAYKYGSDRCPRIKHHYTPYYYELFKDRRNDIKKLLEIGIGFKEDMKHVPDHYVTGAGLYMWRDFFPKAEIYGMDIEPICIFQSERIHTYLRSQSRVADINKVLKETGTDIDIVIDDGSHMTSDQVFTAQVLIPQLKKDVVYIIEDLSESREVAKRLGMFNVEIINFENRKTLDDRLVVVRNK
jgi:hypothetical protein